MTTSSPGDGKRIGSQVPRLRNSPDYVKTYGPEVIDFMTMVGRPLDPWQQLVINDAFGVRADGLWSAFEVVALVARQNGKGAITEAIELAGAFLFKEKLQMHSAHLFPTAREAFRRLVEIIDGSDWLTRRLKSISRSKGDEGIELTREAGGGRVLFVARTVGGGRGFTGAKTIFDESYALTIAQYAAQTPTLATIPNPQIVYTSTPPDEETGPLPEDAMLPSVRERGQAAGRRIAYHEWSPGPDDDPHDVEVHYRCNPAMGIRISEEFIGAQLDAFQRAGKIGKFETEHLGKWPRGTGEQWLYIPQREWEAALDPDSHREGTIALAIETSLDRQWTSISVAGARPDGLRHVEVAVSERGTGWVVAKVKDMVERLSPCAVVIYSASPAGALLPDLEAADIEMYRMSAQEVAQACGMLFDGVAGPIPDEPGEPSPRIVRHRGQQVLTTSIAGAATRRMSGTNTWDPVNSAVDISPGVGAANALWAYTSFGQYDALSNIF